MPPHLIGAIVPAFVAAPNHVAAILLASRELGGRGYVVEDIPGDSVVQLDPQVWQSYVESTWPEALDFLPNQPDVLLLVGSKSGGVFFGPFAGWERDA